MAVPVEQTIMIKISRYVWAWGDIVISGSAPQRLGRAGEAGFTLCLFLFTSATEYYPGPCF